MLHPFNCTVHRTHFTGSVLSRVKCWTPTLSLPFAQQQAASPAAELDNLLAIVEEKKYIMDSPKDVHGSARQSEDNPSTDSPAPNAGGIPPTRVAGLSASVIHYPSQPTAIGHRTAPANNIPTAVGDPTILAHHPQTPLLWVPPNCHERSLSKTDKKNSEGGTETGNFSGALGWAQAGASHNLLAGR